MLAAELPGQAKSALVRADGRYSVENHIFLCGDHEDRRGWGRWGKG